MSSELKQWVGDGSDYFFSFYSSKLSTDNNLQSILPCVYTALLLCLALHCPGWASPQPGQATQAENRAKSPMHSPINESPRCTGRDRTCRDPGSIISD